MQRNANTTLPLALVVFAAIASSAVAQTPGPRRGGSPTADPRPIEFGPTGHSTQDDPCTRFSSPELERHSMLDPLIDERDVDGWVDDEDRPHAPLVLYVDRDATGQENGRCWLHAFTDLQYALRTAAQVRGRPVEIWVAEGAYRPDMGTDNRYLSFALLRGVAIYGGFVGNERMRSQRDPAHNVTILSGEIGGNGGDLDDNVLHVVTAAGVDETAVLDGFVIRDGSANLIATPRTAQGGGMLVSGASPQVRNCRFESNHARMQGGAVAVIGGAPRFSDCQFAANSAAFGGAIHAQGGASPVISESGFRDNDASSAGGAIYVATGTEIRIASAGFFGNSAGDSGGALASSGAATLVNCVFSGNAAGHGPAAAAGGAVWHSGGAPLRIANCTLASNTSSGVAGGLFVQNGTAQVSSSILWGNADASGLSLQAQFHSTQDGDVDVGWSCVQFLPASWPGDGNIAANPRFVQPAGPDGVFGTADDNLRLLASSPCVDAGDNLAAPADFADLDEDANLLERTPLDYAGFARFFDAPRADTGRGPAPVVDMGAYELNSNEPPRE